MRVVIPESFLEDVCFESIVADTYFDIDENHPRAELRPNIRQMSILSNIPIIKIRCYYSYVKINSIKLPVGSFSTVVDKIKTFYKHQVDSYYIDDHSFDPLIISQDEVERCLIIIYNDDDADIEEEFSAELELKYLDKVLLFADITNSATIKN